MLTSSIMGETVRRTALEPGSKLLWYLIERVLGQGSFGITYLAQDRNLDRRVAIKEYLPAGVAGRDADGDVHPISEDVDGQYRWGLERFITEARTLAKCEHPNIVRVLNVFEEHNSAYMAMAYEEGESLSAVLERRRTLGEAELLGIVLPLLDGLEQVHCNGFIHRDIKPANIFIRTDGSPRLLDFGSARQALGIQTGTLTVLYSPGYAPIEQYGKGDQQGPWSDIFSLGGTLYRAIAGVTPTDVLERSQRLTEPVADLLCPALERGRGRYSEGFLKAIDHALSFRPADRPQSVAEWRRELTDKVPEVSEAHSVQELTEAVMPQESQLPPGAPHVRRGVVYVSAALGVAGLAGVVWLQWPSDSDAPSPPLNSHTQSPVRDPPPRSAQDEPGRSPKQPDSGRKQLTDRMKNDPLPAPIARPLDSGGKQLFDQPPAPSDGTGRRTGPQEAPAKYHSVLVLEPERVRDEQGIESLLERARRAMEREDWAEARSQLDLAAALQLQAAAALRIELGDLTARQEKRSAPSPDPRPGRTALNEGPLRGPNFSPPSSFPPKTAPGDEAKVELALWHTIKDSRELSVFREYLDRFPGGNFAGLARLKLNEISSAAASDKAALHREQKLSKAEPVYTTPPSALQPRIQSAIAGLWEGQYRCQDEAIGFSLDITEPQGSDISAVFEFFPLPGRLSFPRGKFSMSGRFDPVGKKISLENGEWIKRSLGFERHDIEGQLEASGSQIRGRIVTTGCAEFILKARR